MDQLLDTGWAQGGFAFLMGVSGWYAAFRMYKAYWSVLEMYTNCNDHLRDEIKKREYLVREVVDALEQFNNTLQQGFRYESLEDLFRDQITPLVLKAQLSGSEKQNAKPSED